MTTVDYARFATWDFGAFQKLKATIKQHYKETPTKAGWLQYRGSRLPKSGVFWGSASQMKALHHVVSCSGENAQEFFNVILHSVNDPIDVYCTRLDIQQTIPRPKLPMRKIFKYAPNDKKTYYQSDTETVYIGSRTSSRFARLYEKLEGQFLRLEFELKHTASRRVWAMCISNKDQYQEALQQAFIESARALKLGKWADKHFNLEQRFEDMRTSVEIEELAQDIQKKIAHLQNVETFIARCLDDHTLQTPARAMIARLLHYSLTKD